MIGNDNGVGYVLARPYDSTQSVDRVCGKFLKIVGDSGYVDS